MSERDADKREEKPERVSGCGGRKPLWTDTSASSTTVRRDNLPPKARDLMIAVVERGNMNKALQRVERNKGSAGIDGMAVSELRSYLREQWPRIKEELLKGIYKPQPVLRVEIAKAGGGMRKLGIPTVVDRLIQQAIHQVLSPIYESTFSESSYGFRPKRSAHEAVRAARGYVAEGRQWVVDMDLEKFFDRVNHDVLMSRIARRIGDKAILRTIRRYLTSGVMVNGIEEARGEGTPQGGPISPLLSNILLDDLDKELERRGHKFCRYADDCNVYVRSKAAGERVKDGLTRFLEKKLRLKVNEKKSAVDRPWNRKFLGYTMTRNRTPRLKVAKESVKRMKDKVKKLFRAGRGRNLGRFIREELSPVLRGWAQYFRMTEVKGILEELDGWLRRKLRCILWRQWKRGRTRYKRLIAAGLAPERARRSAWNGRGAWWNSGASHMNEAYPKRFFDSLGLVSLLKEVCCSRTIT
ncbi:MAG: group II intron reverse transcriptase/maturase [Pseudomonadota bacterium]